LVGALSENRSSTGRIRSGDGGRFEFDDEFRFEEGSDAEDGRDGPTATLAGVRLGFSIPIRDAAWPATLVSCGRENRPIGHRHSAPSNRSGRHVLITARRPMGILTRHAAPPAWRSPIIWAMLVVCCDDSSNFLSA
jgi:hypothetical protein